MRLPTIACLGTALLLPGLGHGQGRPRVTIDRSEFLVSTLGPDGKRTSRESNRVPLVPEACYEWRLHVAGNPSGEIEWTEAFELPAPGNWGTSDDYEVRGDGRIRVSKRREVPKDGWIGREWCVVESDPSGRYVITVHVQDSLAKVFEFVVAPPTQEEDSVIAEVLGQQIRMSQSRQMTGIILSALLTRYVEEHKIAPTDDEVSSLRQRLPEFFGTEEMAWNFLQTWKVNRSLFDRYGGRVALVQEAPVPLEAYGDFLRDHERRGSFRIIDTRLEPSFWSSFADDTRSDFLPPDEARAAFDNPWWLAAAPSPAQEAGPTEPGAPLTLTGVSAGSLHTCGVTAAGAAWCWGLNSEGQLGDGQRRMAPSTPVALAGGVTFATVSAGSGHTCGVTAGGAAYCWGTNGSGELGDGTTTTRPSPVAVVGGVTFAAVSAGDGHTCGVTAAGAAYCWGANGWGELGDSTLTQRSSPVPVAGGLRFAGVSAGRDHTCGVTVAGAAYCWGYNFNGRLGNDAPGPEFCPPDKRACSTMPTPVAGDLTLVALSAGGFHSCGITAAGAAHCWGTNSVGQLGDGTTTTRSAPVLVTGGLTFAAVSAGGETHTCGVTTAGAAHCWGSNAYGELGDGSTSLRRSPVRVAGDLVFAAVSAGGFHTCGVTTAGAAYCWGNNHDGQLGDGTTTVQSRPVLARGAPARSPR